MRISDWSSDVCSSDLPADPAPRTVLRRRRPRWPPPWLDRCTRQSGTSVSLIRTPREAAMMKLYYDETMNPRKVCAVARYLDSRSEEHTSELQSLMRNSYAVFCLKKKNTNTKN